MIQETAINSQDEAKALVSLLALQLRRPSVVLLSGGLGAGKTQFVRWFLSALRVPDVASPTFAIHHAYATPEGDVDHVDLYRLQSDADLESSGFWDLFTREDALVFVEWADRLPDDVWPLEWQRVHIHITKGEGDARRVRVELKLPSTKS